MASEGTITIVTTPAAQPTNTATARWYLLPAAIALASRVYSVLLLFLLGHQGAALPLLVGDDSPFVAWDGQWYLHIAEFGYHATPLQNIEGISHFDFAFFPAWPLLIRLVSLGGLLPMAGTAVVVANVLFVTAAVVLYRLFADRFDGRTAIGGVLLFAFNPAAYVFSMAYSESLFVLLVGLFFVYDTRRRGPVAAGLATLTRLTGLAIGVSQVVMLAIRRDGRRIRLLTCVAVALAFAGWWAYIWLLTGNPTGWLDGSPSWNVVAGPAAVLRALRREPFQALLWLSFVGVMVIGSALLLRKQTDLSTFGLAAIALSVVGAPTQSMPRHAMVAIGAFAALALYLGPRWSVLLTAVFAAAQVLFVEFAFGVQLHHAP